MGHCGLRWVVRAQGGVYDLEDGKEKVEGRVEVLLGFGSGKRWMEVKRASLRGELAEEGSWK